MLLMVEHFRTPGAHIADLEPVRKKLLPDNKIPLETVFQTLKKSEIIL